jgi:hypothetical protein
MGIHEGVEFLGSRVRVERDQRGVHEIALARVAKAVLAEELADRLGAGADGLAWRGAWVASLN